MDDMKTYAVLHHKDIEVPDVVLKTCRRAAERLRDRGWILSSAGTWGLCQPFVEAADGRSVVWTSHEGLEEKINREQNVGVSLYVGESGEAMDDLIAMRPGLKKLGRKAWPFMCRDWHTVAGLVPSWAPAKFVLYYKPSRDGWPPTGVEVARHKRITTINLAEGQAALLQIKKIVEAYPNA